MRSRLLAALVLAAPMLHSATLGAQALRVTLLGTGSPDPRSDRFGPSTLVEAGGQRLLFDCGRGTPIRLTQVGVPMGRITAVFLTHLHSDHVVGLPDLWLTGWLANRRFGGRERPLRLYGPAGTADMARGLRVAYAADLRIRSADEHLPADGAELATTEIGSGVVYDSAGVTVTAFEVDHGDSIKPAFGYRVAFGGHVIVLSGDTRPTATLLDAARGADLVVHEVAMGRASDASSSAALNRVLAHHTSPEDAGRMFARARPALAVYSHIVLATYAPTLEPPTNEDLVRATRTTYDGPLVIGEDLMRFDVGDRVTVHSPRTHSP